MTKMNLRLKLHFLCLLCLCPLFHAFSQWQRVVHQRAVHHTAPKVAMSDMGQRVETALANKFKKRDIRRVLESWRRLREGEVFEKEYADWGVQNAHSFVKGLRAQPWHELNEYGWMTALEREADTIKAELEKNLASTDLQQRGNNVWATALTSEAEGYGPDWRTLVLQDHLWDETNAALFPETCALFRKHGVPSCEVFFARQAAGTGIKPHTDNTNFILTAHLGLQVPEGDCWIEVGNERRRWETGQGMVFDTSFVHSTANNADTDRYVLITRFWHPQLTQSEVSALSKIFRYMSDPTFLEEDERLVATTNAKGFGKH